MEGLGLGYAFYSYSPYQFQAPIHSKGAVLQIGRSLVRFLTVSSEFSLT